MKNEIKMCTTVHKMLLNPPYYYVLVVTKISELLSLNVIFDKKLNLIYHCAMRITRSKT